MIPDDHFFTWSDARMENDVTAGEGWRVEEINHASELKMSHQSNDSSNITYEAMSFYLPLLLILPLIRTIRLGLNPPGI